LKEEDIGPLLKSFSSLKEGEDIGFFVKSSPSLWEGEDIGEGGEISNPC